MMRLSDSQRIRYDYEILCYIFRPENENNETKGTKFVTTSTSRAGLSAPAIANVTWSARTALKFLISFIRFHVYNAHLIVHEFGKQPDR